MKDMAIFFKKIEVPPGMEPGAEIKKVLDFRQSLINEKKVFFRDFTALDSFKEAVRAKLMEIGWLDFKGRTAAPENSKQEDKPPRAEIETEITSPHSSRLIDLKAQDFVSELLRKPADWDAVEPQEVARFRLISASLMRSGNDEIHLGTHDANLVYRHYRNAVLSEQEFMALIDCGVAGFVHQNVPLWTWIAKADMGADYLYRIRVLATVGSDDEKVGAIRVLQRLNFSLPTHDGDFDKAGVLTNWLSNDTASRVFDAAISFIASNASENDIPLIQQASAELPVYKKSRVDSAIIDIVSRRSLEDALTHVCNHNVSSVSNEFSQRLLSASHSLTTGTLQMCLSAKPDAIRVGAAKILRLRGEIHEESANILLTDDNAEVRLVAAEVLHDAGRGISKDVLEKVLKVQKVGALGLFGTPNNGPDTTQLEIYRANRRAELSAARLMQMADEDVLQYKCLETLFVRHGLKFRAQIREGLKDSFDGYFKRSTARFREQHSSDDGALQLLDETLHLFRRNLMNIAVRALCKLGKSDDLDLIRQCVDSTIIDAHEIIFQFLSRFGDWKDVERILKIGISEGEKRSIFSIEIVSHPKERASALVSVGKNRIADLLDLKIDANVRTQLLQIIPKSSLALIPDDLILRELSHPIAECRVIFAMRCVQIFSKARIGALLESYIHNSDSRYYNSIHWLDLGVAMPSKLRKLVVEKELLLRSK